MANFAVSAVTVTADGWSCDVTLAGQAGQQGAITYDFGTPGSTSTSDFYLLVTSEGYNSAGVLGTVQRYVYATKAVRQPYPNEASLDEVDSGADIVVRVSLSDYIYNDDKDGGAGTSGVDLQCVIQSGVFTVGADTNEAYNSSATNSSTQDYPKAFGQWATVPFQSFTSDPTLKFTARHRHKIAAVKFTLTDASLNSVNGFATSEVSNQRSVSGYYASEYEKELSLTTLTQGEVLTANAVLYPVVGDADSVFDTATATVNANNTALGQCNYSFYNNKTGAATVTKYIATTGNDTTGDGSSGNPWATVQKALTEGSADDIECAAGTYTFGAVTAPSSINRWRVVRPASGASVTVSIDGLESYNTPHLEFRGVTIQKAINNTAFHDSTGARYIRFSGCTMDSNSTTAWSVPSLAYGGACCFINDCTFDDTVPFGLHLTNSTYTCPVWMDGNLLPAGTANTTLKSWVRIVANDMDDLGVADWGTNQLVADPIIIEFNKVHSWSTAGTPTISLADNDAIAVGCSFTGNVCERTATTNPILELSANNGTDIATLHVLVWHNTFAGERCNFAYNANGTAAVNQLLWSVIGNSFAEYNIKSDTDTSFGSASGNRVGNWANLYGVGFVSNAGEQSNFNNEYPGLDSPKMPPTATSTPNYTTDASYTGTAAGDGNYLPASPSDLIAALLTGYAMVPKDKRGKPVGNAGEGEIGGIQLAPAPTISDVSPATATLNSTGVTITLTGTGFVTVGTTTATITAVGKTAHTVNSVTVNDSTDTDLNVDFDGEAGTYTITLTNPDGQSTTSTIEVISTTVYDGTESFKRAGAWYPLKLRKGGTFRFRS